MSFSSQYRAVVLTCVAACSLYIHPATAQTPSPPAPAQQTSDVSGDREVSIRELPGNIIEDQKRIWNFPFKPERVHHWWPPVIVLGVTGAVLASDPYTAPHFLNTTTFHGYQQ
jgi:hypothetical protein